MIRIASVLCLSILGVVLTVRAADGDAKPRAPDPKIAKLQRDKMEEIDRTGQDKDGRRRRPWVIDQEHKGTCLTDDLYIHDVIDHKGIFISATSTDKGKVDGLMPTYQEVIVRNCEIGPVTLQTRGLHIDAIKADGSTEAGVKPTLTVKDVFIHDTNGGVMTILVKDGSWAKVTLRRVECVNVAHPIIIAGSEQYPIGDVLIEDCPGLRVAIQENPGTVGTVTVRDSQGADVNNVRDGRGVAPWSKIVVENKPATRASK